MTITKKLELAARLKREMDSAIETLMKRDGLTRAAAVDRVILSPEVSRVTNASSRSADPIERTAGSSPVGSKGGMTSWSAMVVPPEPVEFKRLRPRCRGPI